MVRSAKGAEKANADPASITDEDVDRLRTLGLTDKGVVKLAIA